MYQALCRNLIIFSSFALLVLPITGQATEIESDTWQFHLAGYGWLSGQEGTLSTMPGYPDVDVDLDFWDDISSNINGALYMIAEAKKGKIGGLIDISYSDIEMEETTPGAYFHSLKSRTETWMVTPALFYRLHEQQKAFVDVFAGGRYWSVKSDISLTSGMLPGGKVKNSESWIDPLIGVKGATPIGNSAFFISGGASIGGFDVSSKFFFEIYANLGYNWTPQIATLIGYRYLDVDYSDNGYTYDVVQQGPTIALSWRF